MWQCANKIFLLVLLHCHCLSGSSCFPSQCTMSAANKKKRYMFRTAVKPEKLELYKLHHAMVWEAVEVGLRSSGVDLLTIWGDKQHGNVLQMYIETTGADLATITGPGTEGYVPEWEELMQSFFEAGQWVEMDEIYTLTSKTSTNATGEQLVELKKKLENLEQKKV